MSNDWTHEDRKLDWATGRELERKDAEIARLRSELDYILAEHELMRRTLETISGSASDRLQATQARGALANIGPAIQNPPTAPPNTSAPA